MGIIQQELDQIKQIYNTHRIRTYPNREYPRVVKYSIDISKITLHLNFISLTLSLFFLSLFTISDNTNKIAPVTEMDLNNVLSSDHYTNKSNFGCVPEFEKLALHLMLAYNLTFPTNVEEVRQVYNKLL